MGKIFQKSLWWQHGPGVIRKFKIIGSGTQVPCQRLQKRRTTRMTSCITKALLIYYRVHAYPDQLRFIFFAGSWIIWTYMVSLLLQQFKQADVSLSQRVCLWWTDSSIHQDDTIHRSDQEFSFPLFSMSSALLTPSEHQRLLFVWEILYSQYFFKPWLQCAWKMLYRNRNIQLHNRDLIAIFCPCKMVKINKLLNIPHSRTIHLSNGDTARKSKPLEL